VQRSTLPVYHPLLRELLTSAPSRRTKPLKTSSLIHPPKLPDRAIHRDSEEARLLGPFSKRREVNTRWRFFSEEVRKIHPPVEVSQEGLTGQTQGTSHDFAAYGFKGEMVRHITELSGPNHSPTIPRRERQRILSNETQLATSTTSSYQVEKSKKAGALPTRWLRRRYRELLHTVPLVSQRPRKDKGIGYSIKLSSNALGEHTKATMARIGVAKSTDLEWIEKASAQAGQK
jgi:hypothetical protein